MRAAQRIRMEGDWSCDSCGWPDGAGEPAYTADEGGTIGCTTSHAARAANHDQQKHDAREAREALAAALETFAGVRA